MKLIDIVKVVETFLTNIISIYCSLTFFVYLSFFVRLNEGWKWVHNAQIMVTDKLFGMTINHHSTFSFDNNSIFRYTNTMFIWVMSSTPSRKCWRRWALLIVSWNLLPLCPLQKDTWESEIIFLICAYLQFKSRFRIILLCSIVKPYWSYWGLLITSFSYCTFGFSSPEIITIFLSCIP